MTCPSCRSKRYPLGEPEAGAVLVCGYCGAAFACEPSVSIRLITGADFALLDEATRANIAKAQDGSVLPIRSDHRADTPLLAMRTCSFCGEPLGRGTGRPRDACRAPGCIEARDIHRLRQSRARRAA